MLDEVTALVAEFGAIEIAGDDPLLTDAVRWDFRDGAIDAEAVEPLASPPCRYRRHRATDWRLAMPGSRWVCGRCHPPTAAGAIVRRADSNGSGA